MVSYGGLQDRTGKAEIFAGGETVTLKGNAWKAVPVNFEFLASAYLDFDFSSDESAEIQAIGFDNNVAPSAEKIFKLAGSQTWGVLDFDGLYRGPGLKHYRIPIGLYGAGKIAQIVLINDNDKALTAGSSTFSNLKVCYDRVLTWPQEASISSYGTGDQDSGGTTIIENDHVVLSGNNWIKIPLPATINDRSLLSFDFVTDAPAEIYAIGFDTDAMVTPKYFLQLGGTQQFAPRISAMPGRPGHYQIAVGQYFQGQFRYLVLVADSDSSPATPFASFGNITFSESEIPLPRNGVPAGGQFCDLRYSCNSRRCTFKLRSRAEIGKAIPVVIEKSINHGEEWQPFASSRSQTIFSGQVRVPVRKAYGNLFRMRVPSASQCVTEEVTVVQHDLPIADSVD